MRATVILAFSSVVLVLTGCDNAATTALETTLSAPVAPTPVSLVMSPDTAVMVLGERQSYVAVKVMSNGSRVPVLAHWTSLPPDVVSMGLTGFAVAVSDGRATIRATAEGLIAVGSVTVLKPISTGESDALIVEAFWMTEFQYPTVPNHWFYAPQVRVRAASGRSVTVLRLTFSIPGLPDPIPPWGCGALISLAVPRNLNGEVYGDWALTMDHPQHRANGEDATATISFVDENGVLSIRTVRGPILGGALPSTYEGEPGACFKGYRAPG